MTVQNEVAWLLGVIQDQWPGTSWPDDLVRRNRDDHVTLDKSDSPVKEMGVSLDQYNSVGVSTGSKNRELFGTKPQYNVETTLDVRVEGKHEDEWGRITDDDEFKTLVAYIQHAIDTQLTYPSVDTGDEDIGRVTYEDLGILTDTHNSVEQLSHYLRVFTVVLRGKQDTP